MFCEQAAVFTVIPRQQAEEVWCAETVVTQDKHFLTSPDFIGHGLITCSDEWPRVLHTVTGSSNCVLASPRLSGYKQSHLAAARVILPPHPPLLSLSRNLCQLSGGRSFRVKTWQVLSMSKLRSKVFFCFSFFQLGLNKAWGHRCWGEGGGSR